MNYFEVILNNVYNFAIMWGNIFVLIFAEKEVQKFYITITLHFYKNFYIAWVKREVYVKASLYARQQKRHRGTKQSFGLCGRGRWGMIWENGIKTCITSYKKQITSPGLMQDTGSLGLVHWDDPEGWYGEGDGRGVQDGEHVYTHGRCMLM